MNNLTLVSTTNDIIRDLQEQEVKLSLAKLKAYREGAISSVEETVIYGYLKLNIYQERLQNGNYRIKIEHQGKVLIDHSGYYATEILINIEHLHTAFRLELKLADIKRCIKAFLDWSAV